LSLAVTFDQGPDRVPARFAAPRRLIAAWEPRELEAAFAEMEAARGAGYWLAGYASYELGYCLSERLAPLIPRDRDLPLLAFGVYDGPGEAPLAEEACAAALSWPVPRWDPARYAGAFARLQDYIAAGDVYQANLTFPLDARADGSPAALYAALERRQPVGHGALIEMPEGAILCRSPELFVEIGAGGRIVTRPMKGTAPRGRTAEEDAALRRNLATSEKNRAENLMIVDLLRNDVSRISLIGSVRVPRLFHVETYETVHQMVSEVQGRMRPGITLAQIFEALFPCGSVTGAPKIRAMEIIRELEDDPRGAYCGATGWIAPDGAMRLGVAIRTLTVWPDGRVQLNVGGGVVHDSTGPGEYEEALWKARFADLSRTV
jgi:para-aminobenzoate synthetase component I